MSLAAAPAMADDWRHGPPGPGAGPGGPGPGPGGPRGWADRHDERRDRHDRRDAYRDGYRDGRYSRPVVVERNYYRGGYYHSLIHIYDPTRQPYKSRIHYSA